MRGLSWTFRVFLTVLFVSSRVHTTGNRNRPNDRQKPTVSSGNPIADHNLDPSIFVQQPNHQQEELESDRQQHHHHHNQQQSRRSRRKLKKETSSDHSDEEFDRLLEEFRAERT